MKPFFSPTPLFQQKVIAIIRIIIGLLMIYHGQEVFNAETMKGYTEWDIFKNSTGTFMVYLGKASEFLAGISLFLGLFTRIGAILLIGTMSYITFFVGHGKFWYEDQHPFMFALFGFLFAFTGSGTWSIDEFIFER